MQPEIAPDRFAAGMAQQRERLRRALAGGMPRRGWKIGINVPEVLRHLELPHSGVAWIDGRRVLEDGAQVEAPEAARLRVEPEVAIRLARDVPADADADAARRCIDALHPALEVVSYARPGGNLDELVAHCMFHEATVLGPASAPERADALGREWPQLRVGDRPADPPRDDLVPADLGELLVFAARFLEAFGERLAAGDLLLSGSFTARALPVSAGDEITAEFGALGTVTARFVSG